MFFLILSGSTSQAEDYTYKSSRIWNKKNDDYEEKVAEIRCESQKAVLNIEGCKARFQRPTLSSLPTIYSFSFLSSFPSLYLFNQGLQVVY